MIGMSNQSPSAAGRSFRALSRLSLGYTVNLRKFSLFTWRAYDELMDMFEYHSLAITATMTDVVD